MSEDIIALLKENVIQGRQTKEDEGLDEDLSGTPGVVELLEQALEQKIPADKIITEGLTAGMQVVGEKFSAKEYFIPDMLAAAEAVGAAMDILRSGKKVITGSYQLAAQLDDIDIVTDITPSPAIGAETALSCIQHRKDVVMVNIEADVTIGAILKKKAAEAGILYTVSSGDEPGCLMELYDFVKTIGFEPIVIGKGKNNPLNPQANPDMGAESAKKANKDPYQVASYVDGPKTMFEMTCAANATGAKPIQRGMIGPFISGGTVVNLLPLGDRPALSESDVTPLTAKWV